MKQLSSTFSSLGRLLFVCCSLWLAMTHQTNAQCPADITCDDANLNWEHVYWDQEIRSAVKIVSDYVGDNKTCSGVLLNNTSLDNTLYVLTAFHCIDNNGDGILTQQEKDGVADFEFYFHYYNEICGDNNSTTTPIQLNQYNKAIVVSSWVTTDFALIQLDTTFSYCDPDMENHLFWAGWSRSTTPFSSSTDLVVGLHHPTGTAVPGGLPMQTAVYNGDGQVFNGDNNYWEVPDLWDIGDVDDGSSGSPLFNDAHLVVGQNQGGSAYVPCVGHPAPNNDYTTYGRFDISWLGGGTIETQLRAWLCPDCDHNPDPISLQGTEYIGGTAVGGKGFTCNDITLTVSQKPLPACCWDIEIELQNGACITGVQASLDGYLEQTITDYHLIDGKLRFRYCISGSTGLTQELWITVLGTNGSPICPTEKYNLVRDSLTCEACNCHNAYEVRYRPSGLSYDNGQEGWCCYIPVIEKLDEDACDIYGGHTEATGHAGLYDTVPLLDHVGDTVELPEVCVEPFTGTQWHKVFFYDKNEDPGSGFDPICDVSGRMDACCSCNANYDVEIITTGYDIDECCFKVNVTWDGDEESCKPKSVALFDELGTYTGEFASHVDGISFVSFQNLCFDRTDLPITYQIRFYDDFLTDPQNLPEEDCHIDITMDPCHIDCCELFDITTVPYSQYDPSTGLSYNCTDLVVTQTQTNPACPVTAIEVYDYSTQSGVMIPWTPPSVTYNLCCVVYGGLGSVSGWVKVVMHGPNGPIVDTLTGDTCQRDIFYACSGFSTKQKVGIADNAGSHETFRTIPNPADDLTWIDIEMPDEAHVRLELYDQKGSLVKVIKDGQATEGLQRIPLNTATVEPGLYLLRLSSTEVNKTIRLVVHH